MSPVRDNLSAESLAEGVLGGDRRAIARAVSLIEAGSPKSAILLELLYPATGKAHVVGVTGPPGAGKSTLVGRLGIEAMRLGRTIAVLALDPSSPYTGGALLGDRLRMPGLSDDPRAYVRSMASRGARGGLARAARDAVRVLDAAGFDLVVVETVGAGQSELDVTELAQTTVVVAVPELGDEIQALKAGLYEAADVFVVNKSDLPGSEQAVLALELGADRGEGGWRPPIVRCVATTGLGVPELLVAIDAHRVHVTSGGRLAERHVALAAAELADALRDTLLEELLDRAGTGPIESAVARVALRETDARSAARTLVERYFSSDRQARGDTQPKVSLGDVLEYGG